MRARRDYGTSMLAMGNREQNVDVVLSWPDKPRLDLEQPRIALDELGCLELVAGTGEGEPNLLIHGDNATAMRALMDRYGGCVDLIYIDPPYATGLSYYSQTDVGGGDAIERRAYRDNRARGMAGYLDHMYLRLALMHRLLSDDGKLFVHCDWRANSMLRLLLDEIFGADCFRNEIIWRRAPNLGRQAASRQLGRVIDSIFVYSKTPGAEFGGTVPKRRARMDLDGKGKPKGARWDPDREAYYTTAPRGDYTDASIAKLSKEGRVHVSASGTVYIKYFLVKGDDGTWYKEQPVDALWDDYEVRPLRHRPKSEDMGYDTQKPEGLLERIVSWATKPGDLVADFFCGSGTTLAVAERMGRRWIGSDAGEAAVDITRRRLIALGPTRPFEVRSVMRAERRLWMGRLSQEGGEHAAAAAVLEAYGAELVVGRFGRSGDDWVWVGPALRTTNEQDVQDACEQAASRDAKRLVVLAWEWASHDPASLRASMRKHHGVELRLRTIPADLVRRQSGKHPLRFAERAEADLELVPGEQARCLSVRLTGVRCPDPPKLRANAKHEPTCWSELVASWSVDWSMHGDGFAPAWRSEPRQNGEVVCLQTPAHDFGKQPTSTVQVKVVTIYGDEIVRTLRVEC